MTWNLFLDDCRSPKFEGIDPSSVVVCRSAEEALSEFNQRGLPAHMYLDYDLGMGTSLGFLKVLKERFPKGPFPSYRIISEHPERYRISSFMDEWENGPELSVYELPVGTIVETYFKDKVVRAKILEVDGRQRYKVLLEKDVDFTKVDVIYPTRIFAYTLPE